MTSARKIAANQANCRKSTGPKTAAGRAASSRNALRHGLRVPVLSDPALSRQVEAMAQAMVSQFGRPDLLALARDAAEAEVDVLRIRRVRAALIPRALEIEHMPTPPPLIEKHWLLGGPSLLDLIPEGLSFKFRRLYKRGQRYGLPSIERLELKKPQSFGRQFSTIDTYERRALSRRKFAIRAFDEARSRGRCLQCSGETEKAAR